MLNHPRAYLGDYRMLTRTKFGQLIFVDTRDVSISPHIIMSGDWEPWVTNALRNGCIWAQQVFVDVGANCGWYSLLAASMGMTVYSFEPQTHLCELMRQTAAVNGYAQRWSVDSVPLSATSGESVSLICDPDNQGGAHLQAGLGEGFGPPLERVTACLDDKIPPGSLVNLIKIDVEGYEHKVLLGAQRVLAENREITLAVEHHRGDEQMIEWLLGLGFKLGHFAHSGQIVDCSVRQAAELADAEMLCFKRS